MYFRQFYLGCLAHASYLIGSEGQAVVVDPQRDVDMYLDQAEVQGLKILYIVETHLHADFVSGHRELAERTGAEIVFGRECNAAFPFRAVQDGEEITIGRVVLRFLETPGHTPESISVLVTDTEAGKEPQKVLTGDTLFIGDVGRPDLVGSRGYSAEQMAEALYDSLHEKLLKLDDAVEVYPAHGAGSLCGRNISQDTSSTIGEQRRFNYALQPMARDDFVRIMTSDLPTVPAYFPRDAELNRRGAVALDDLATPKALKPSDIDIGTDLVLDVRDAPGFSTAHTPGAINIALGGQFASWAGSLLPTGKSIVIVADTVNDVSEAVLRLARVGIEEVKGYLQDGIYAWDREGRSIQRIEQIPVDELRSRIQENDLQLVDVRNPEEFNQGHLPQALNIPLARLEAEVARLKVDSPIAVICQGGYRSSIASSILAARGFRHVTNVIGGTAAWIGSGYETERAMAGG